MENEGKTKTNSKINTWVTKTTHFKLFLFFTPNTAETNCSIGATSDYGKHKQGANCRPRRAVPPPRP